MDECEIRVIKLRVLRITEIPFYGFDSNRLPCLSMEYFLYPMYAPMRTSEVAAAADEAIAMVMWILDDPAKRRRRDHILQAILYQLQSQMSGTSQKI